MTQRYTVETLASGQPRPYADSRLHVRLTIEYHFQWLGDPNHEKSEWRPSLFKYTEDEMKALLRALKCGFPQTDQPKDWADSVLLYLKQPKPEEEPHIWEFYTTSAYTD